ncbi:MAG: large conductance mechanosensitive channel protein MscL [Geminicoccaceae bacterium]|nr:large conductance mechanosensitive channel protein MscL [Geminicoccaceae bacterium]MDW8124831.1 large conductance mechanosensitive channel protein MscL [Geminicoccaceae bacterium]
MSTANRDDGTNAMLEEFREFALRGNVLDMAVGIVIGAAFTAIVTSLVEDVIMPPIGVLVGGIDFSDYFVQLTKREVIYPTVAAARQNGAAVLAWGSFLNAVIKFLIVAFAVFLLVKQVNRLRRLLEGERAKGPAPPPAPPPEVALLTEIRDLLKARS